MFSTSNIRHRIGPLASLLLLMLVVTTATAAESDNNNHLRIQADYMRFDIETGSSVYQGNVTISQDGIVLNGEKVIIRRENDEIRQIDVAGTPARYAQDEQTENSIRATSEQMQYFAKENRLVLQVDARLEQPDHTIESQRIVYDTRKKIVIAGDEEAQQGGRVNITLTPKKDKTETEKQ